MKILKACLITGLAAFLCSCTVGPDYVRPPAAEPAAYRETPVVFDGYVDWRPATPGHVDTGSWWESFQDPLLNQLMVELGQSNQNIQVSLANLRQARAAVREARAAFFPVIGATGSFARGKTITTPQVGNTYTLALEASWEADIWGAISRQVEASTAQAEAQAASLGTVLLSMRGELALNYFQLRTNDSLIELYTQTVQAYTRSLQITQNQYHAGTVTRADVAQAKAQLKAAMAQKVDIELQRRQTENAIALLLGRPPAQFSLAPAPLRARLPVIDAGLPSTLLERRPDVATAERQVASANAAIGVAQSAWFPVLSFSANGGYSGPTLHRLFSAPNKIWSLGPALAQTLFDGGARSARKDQAVAAWEAAAANYRQAVLQALTDVENALAAVRLLKEEESLQNEALAAARDAERLALDQYQAGTVTYLNVVVAQATALNDARTLVQLEGSRFAAAVTLIRALGGGWDTRQLNADGTALPDKPPPPAALARPAGSCPNRQDCFHAD